MEEWKLQPARDLALRGLARYRSVQRESGLVESGLRLLWWGGVRLWLRLWHGLQVHGGANLPADGPFVLVANHASHLDALVLGAALPLHLRDRLSPLAAGDVFFERVHVAAFAASVLNAVPVWRRRGGRHGLVDLRKRLVEGRSVYVLFPEGARTRDGRLMRFKPGVGMLVAGTPVPVVPCYLTGTFEALPANRVVPRPHRITLWVGQPRAYPDVPNEREGWDRIAADLDRAVRELGGLPPAGPGGRAD
jgi:1-acyl-sn-glycerol-3-phosphate acyltransferase